MEKNYDHNASEEKLYAQWEASGAMRTDETSDRPPFTIPLPPPNVTGQLHLGHAAMLAIEDILIRYKKMTGHEALWVPGTDHAAIATENVVLKHLGLKSREEMSREDFLSECRKFATEKHDRIVTQTKKMGAWLDWSREAYTFDQERNFAVNWIFKKLYEDGLIVRGHRMVNWSVGAQSVLADDEVEFEDNETDFYEFWCGPFLIGTVRTETKCADSPVIVHPTAEYVRAKNAEGRECIVTKKYFDEHTLLRKDFTVSEIVPGSALVGIAFEAETYAGMRKFYVMADEVIDPEFGTGAMTISTAHSPEDFEIAQKYDLPLLQKIDFAGKMTAIAGPCEGLPVAAARKKAGEILAEKGLLFEKRPHTNRVPKCYRSGTVVEPMLSPQWFISVEKEFTDEFTGKKTTLKKLMQEAVRDKHVKIIPEKFEKVYFQWIDNLRDWCISRQIWWGHQIPVWYDEDENIHLPEKQDVLFARHGESEANAKNIIGGDHPLTDAGLQTAHEIAESARGRGIKKVVCSDKKRGKQTAEIVAAELGAELEVWPELGEFTSSEMAELAKLERTGPFEIQLDEETDETLIDICRRAQDVIEKIQNEDDVLVIGHQNFTAAMFHFSRSDDEKKFVTFRRSWQWERGALKKLTLLRAPEAPRVAFIRHGESEWNAEGRIQGQHVGGNPLTEKGREQACERAATLAGKNFKKIISSDLERARETAEILRTELGISAEVEIWPELREWHTGDSTTKKIQDVFGTKKFPYDLMAEKFEAGTLGPDADSPEKLQERIEGLLAKLQDEQDVLVVTHGGLLGSIEKFLQDGHLRDLPAFFRNKKDPKNGELITLPTVRLTQDEDTLDTWFSSALWPFSTLGWPDTDAPDFKKFYPTAVLETGHDILFFWVARMIMFGRYATGKYPFEAVYLHGLVCDEHGQKMSKSKGNGIDPLEVIEEVGADAVRLSLVVGATPGNPIPLGKPKIRGYRNFVNKLWNAGRFVGMQDETEPTLEPTSIAERWILSQLSTVSAAVRERLDKFQISEAGDLIYHFVWDEFCSWFLETQKNDKNPGFLRGIFAEILKLAHPLVPYVTEQLWHDLGHDGMLIERAFPTLAAPDPDAEKLFKKVQAIVTEVRKIRADKSLNPREKINIFVPSDALAPAADLIGVLAAADVTAAAATSKPDRAVTALVDGLEVWVAVPFDPAAEKSRLEKEISAADKRIAGLEGRLANKNYTDRAPEHLVQQTRDELAAAQADREKLAAELAQI